VEGKNRNFLSNLVPGPRLLPRGANLAADSLMQV
jgi:hypothetical protein